MNTKKCHVCDGKGVTYGPQVAEYNKCRACSGTGIVTTCTFCRGTGWYTPSGLFNSSKRCPHCDGRGYH